MNRYLLLAAGHFLLGAVVACAEVKVTVDHNSRDDATPAFAFKTVPSPGANDVASPATFLIVSGGIDSNSGSPDKLHDGKLPADADEPAENLFFTAGSSGGRLQVDLKNVTDIRQVNTYSWHPGPRGPQVYKLYAADGTATNFNAAPKGGTSPEQCGWKLVASVNTKPKSDDVGGQYGVSIAAPDGNLGRYRYLLFDISATERNDDFGNTFLSEIDVVDASSPVSQAVVASPALVVPVADGSTRLAFDTTAAPELADWAEHKLAPVLAEWYPKIVSMLPSETYVAPKEIKIRLRPMDGVAFASGTSITASSKWLKGELKGEAVGALIHELIHVVQHCNTGTRRNLSGGRVPGWMIEGIPDYIRWFRFEPQSHGADLIYLQSRPNTTLKYDAKYRVTANFINYVVENYDTKHTLIGKLSEACGNATYQAAIWKEATGKSLDELNDEWAAALKAQLSARLKSGVNVLTAAERSAGWRLLFNGMDLSGWHNFKREDVRPGWQVKDEALVCADPHDAGDIVTEGQFGNFELELDYNISEGGNSGIMFRVTDDGGAAWASGPEFQLEDNAKAADPQRSGWLYALYQPPVDAKTGKPIDATKPAGEWNHIRLVVGPDKCEHWMNGVKYFDYVIGGDEFNTRLAKSKFSKMPLFAKAGSGRIALQGDHGQVSFRNIKIRSIP